MSLGGQREPAREGRGGGRRRGIAAGITELQNPQRHTHTHTEREGEGERQSHKQHHSQLDGTTVNRIGKRTEEQH